MKSPAVLEPRRTHRPATSPTLEIQDAAPPAPERTRTALRPIPQRSIKPVPAALLFTSLIAVGAVVTWQYVATRQTLTPDQLAVKLARLDRAEYQWDGFRRMAPHTPPVVHS